MIHQNTGTGRIHRLMGVGTGGHQFVVTSCPRLGDEIPGIVSGMCVHDLISIYQIWVNDYHVLSKRMSLNEKKIVCPAEVGKTKDAPIQKLVTWKVSRDSKG